MDYRLKTIPNFHIVYDLNLWPYDDGIDFTLGYCLLRAVKVAKNPDPDKYSYYGYGTGFDIRGLFSSSNGSGFGKNVIIFAADNISSAQTGNRKKYILILGKCPTDG